MIPLGSRVVDFRAVVAVVDFVLVGMTVACLVVPEVSTVVNAFGTVP